MGIREGYPRLRRRFGRLMAYVQLCRPFTLVAPVMAGLFGVLAPVAEPSPGHVVTAVYVGLTLALAQACGQCINQYADVELDRVVKPYRPLPSGAISREEAMGVAWLLAIFSVGRAFTIGTPFGLVTLALIFFAVFYSLSPLSPRRVNPFLNVGWTAVSRGLIPALAVWSVYGDPRGALHYAAFAFLWCLALQGTKDIGDSEGDRMFGIRTIANSYGARGFLVYAAAVSSAMYVYAYLFVPVMLALIPLTAVALIGLRRQVAGVENNLSWVCFYLGLGLTYVLMFLSGRLG
jgi:4-hydroxybenzoate polyprenyltransferase